MRGQGASAPQATLWSPASLLTSPEGSPRLSSAWKGATEEEEGTRRCESGLEAIRAACPGFVFTCRWGVGDDGPTLGSVQLTYIHSMEHSVETCSNTHREGELKPKPCNF